MLRVWQKGLNVYEGRKCVAFFLYNFWEKLILLKLKFTVYKYFNKIKIKPHLIFLQIFC